MASSFHSEEPHPVARDPGDTASILFTALGIALAVLMLLAIVAPRFLWAGAVNWAVTLGASALAFLVVLAVGFARRERPGEASEESA